MAVVRDGFGVRLAVRSLRAVRAGPAAADGAGYQQSYPCPHGFVSAEHRTYGQNLEQPWIEDAWQRGFTAAYERMTDEANLVGAHGVVGVVDTCHSLTDMGVLEFRLRGTAVQLEGEPPPSGDAARGPPTWPVNAWPS